MSKSKTTVEVTLKCGGPQLIILSFYFLFKRFDFDIFYTVSIDLY